MHSAPQRIVLTHCYWSTQCTWVQVFWLNTRAAYATYNYMAERYNMKFVMREKNDVIRFGASFYMHYWQAILPQAIFNQKWLKSIKIICRVIHKDTFIKENWILLNLVPLRVQFSKVMLLKKTCSPGMLINIKVCSLNKRHFNIQCTWNIKTNHHKWCI